MVSVVEESEEVEDEERRLADNLDSSWKSFANRGAGLAGNSQRKTEVRALADGV